MIATPVSCGMSTTKAATTNYHLKTFDVHQSLYHASKVEQSTLESRTARSIVEAN